MKIYTKTGDQGETGLFGGQRVPKNSLRIHAIGDVDELNALLGVCRSHDNPPADIKKILSELQHELFALGADLATPLDSKAKISRMNAAHVERLEAHIDRLETGLKPLRNFILPGGSPLAAHLHLARAVCRRAERSV